MRALVYLLTRSALNSARFRLQRLREPRYLVPIIAVAGYVWLALGMPGVRSDLPQLETQDLEQSAGGMLQLALIVGLASSWITAARNPAPPFTEAEVQWLFPAPLSRRTLVGYVLLRPQPSLILVAGCFALLGLAGGGAHAAQYGVGIYLLFNLFAFNGTLASMVAARIARSSNSLLRSRLPGLAFGAYVAVALTLAYQPQTQTDGGAAGVMRWFTEWLDTAPASVMLWPWRTAALLPFSSGGDVFVVRALVVAGMVAVCALGALLVDTPFEEAALTSAEAHARRITAFRKGRGALADLSTIREVRPLLPLGATGPAWRAVLWKNLVAFSRMLSLRQGAIASAFLGIPALALFTDPVNHPWAACSLLVVDLAFLLMLGPTWFGQGVRADLQYVDVWKSGPLSGRDVVRGGTYAACSVLFLLAAAAGIVGMAVDPGAPLPALDADTRTVCAVAWILFMGLVAVSVAVDSLLSVFAPAWTLPDRGQTGLENMGRELVSLFARTVLVSFAAIPALALALGVGTALFHAVGSHALIPGALVAFAGCIATTELFCGWAGKRLDRLDPTCEGL
jgi:Putative ABC exporter